MGRAARDRPVVTAMLLLLLLGRLAPLPAQETPTAPSATPSRPLLWELTGDQATVYLYGSIHIAPPDALPPPAAALEAFARSDVLVTEVRLEEVVEATVASAMMTLGMMSDGASSRELFSEKEWALVERWARSTGFPLDAVPRLRPWVLELAVIETAGFPAGFSAEYGLDVYFARLAAERGIPNLGLETVGEQLELLAGAPLKEQARSLVATLQLGTVELAIAELYDAWRTGDEERLAAMIASQYESPLGRAQYDRLFTVRNQAWTERLSELLAGDGVFFVVVGAGHLVGPDNLRALLAAGGYEARRVVEPGEL